MLEAKKFRGSGKETSAIVLSGTCRPEDITKNNTVQSNQLAGLTIRMDHEGEVKESGQKGASSPGLEAHFQLLISPLAPPACTPHFFSARALRSTTHSPSFPAGCTQWHDAFSCFWRLAARDGRTGPRSPSRQVSPINPSGGLLRTDRRPPARPAAIPPVPGMLNCARDGKTRWSACRSSCGWMAAHAQQTPRPGHHYRPEKGTGDEGKELVLARPLAKVYENNGNPIGDLRDLSKGKSAAIVTISMTLPEGGGRGEGDSYDVYVQASHSASSLKGGTLFISPMLGPHKDSAVFAMAAGQIVIEDPEVPTSGVVHMGATLIRDIRPARVGNEFNLILRPVFRSYQVARTIAAGDQRPQRELDSADEQSGGHRNGPGR